MGCSVARLQLLAAEQHIVSVTQQSGVTSRGKDIGTSGRLRQERNEVRLQIALFCGSRAV